MPRTLLTALVLVCSSMAGTLRAQADLDSLLSHELDEVFVGGATRAAPIGLQRIPLAAWRGADAMNVADAARLIPSAHVSTNSRGETLLTLRGVSDRQVAVYLDGVPLTLPWDQRIDLGLLPSGVVGGATVATGNAAARFGANGFGGVVNLVSRDLHGAGRLIEADILGSDPALGRVSGAWLERRGRWSTVVAAQKTESEGAALSAEARLPFSQEAGGLRTNSDLGLTSLFSRIAFTPTATSRVGASVLLVDGTKGVPPEGHLDPAIESVRFWRFPNWSYRSLMLSGEALPAGIRVHGTAWGGLFSQTIDRFSDANYVAADQSEEGDDAFAGARLTAEKRLRSVSFRGLAGWQIANHNQRDYDSSEGVRTLIDDQTYRESTWTIGTEADLHVNPAWVLTSGGGANVLQTHETGLASESDALAAAFMNVGARFAPDEGLEVQASVGRRTRFPSMRERYDDALGRFIVNPNLRPEAAWLFDVGARGRTDRIAAELVLFARRANATMEVEVLADGQRRRVNLGGSSAYGIELSGAATLPGNLRADGHLVLLHTRAYNATERGLLLTETPDRLGTLAVSFRPPQGLNGAIEAGHTGTAYSALSDGLIELEPSVVINFRAGFRALFPSRGLSVDVFGRVNNLTDKVVFPQAGLPAAGRTFVFGISAALG